MSIFCRQFFFYLFYIRKIHAIDEFINISMVLLHLCIVRFGLTIFGLLVVIMSISVEVHINLSEIYVPILSTNRERMTKKRTNNFFIFIHLQLAPWCLNTCFFFQPASFAH